VLRRVKFCVPASSCWAAWTTKPFWQP